MLSNALAGAVARHKDIGQQLINASSVEFTIHAVDVDSVNTGSGSSFFGDLQDDPSEPLITYGPFKCVWIDADSARAQPNSREAVLVGRSNDADVVMKLWLSDILVDTNNAYGETYLDRARYISSLGKRYEILAFDRYGLGIVQPYLMAVVLRGSFTIDG